MKPVLLLALLFVLPMYNCKKNNNLREAINYSVQIFVENRSGQNLLDPNTPGYFKEENIRMYWLVDGKEELFYYPHLDHPFGLVVAKELGQANAYLNIYSVNHKAKENPTTTYIDWGNGDRDTVLAKMTLNPGGDKYQLVEKVWINGTLQDGRKLVK